jgi:hypothetical protein
MEVGQGPNWGCSAKGKKNLLLLHFTSTRYRMIRRDRSLTRSPSNYTNK